MLVGDERHDRRERGGAGNQARDDGAVPPDASVFAEREGLVVGLAELARAGEELAFEAADRGGAQGAAVDAFGARIGREAEAVELADRLAADDDAAGIVELEVRRLVLAQVLHQHRGGAGR